MKNEVRIKPSYTCQDCSAVHYAPMLRDDLWLAIAKDPKGMLCSWCMERILGRELKPEDLSPCRGNDAALFMMLKRRGNETD